MTLKRYSGEGAESMIAFMDEAFATSASCEFYYCSVRLFECFLKI